MIFSLIIRGGIAMWNGIIIAEICFSIIVGVSNFFLPQIMSKFDNKNALDMAE